MAFPERLKSNVRKRAHFLCCLCKSLGVEVHHIIPQEEGGPDTEENAAPLCPSCHDAYGANPQKRKFIREVRDHWYEICENRFATDPEQLAEIKELLRTTARNSELNAFKEEILSQIRSSFPAPLPTHQSEQQNAGQSPSEKLHFELRGDSEAGMEIWLWEERQSNAIKLCDTCGWGNLKMHFSPDDDWIIVQDGGSSMGIDLRLFRRYGGADFREVEAADIAGKCESLAFALRGFPEERLHHRYAQSLIWSQDSASVLIRVSGYGNGLKLNDQGEETCALSFRLNWLGSYSLKNLGVTSDLSEFNKQALSVWKWGQDERETQFV